jgi:hypothetical protein
VQVVLIPAERAARMEQPARWGAVPSQRVGLRVTLGLERLMRAEGKVVIPMEVQRGRPSSGMPVMPQGAPQGLHHVGSELGLRKEREPLQRSTTII